MERGTLAKRCCAAAPTRAPRPAHSAPRPFHTQNQEEEEEASLPDQHEDAGSYAEDVQGSGDARLPGIVRPRSAARDPEAAETMEELQRFEQRMAKMSPATRARAQQPVWLRAPSQLVSRSAPLQAS